MDWFRHDINMESDDAVANLMLDYRTEGLGVYIHTLHLLFLNEGRFDRTKLLRNLQKLSPKNGNKIFEAMLEEGLIKLDGELVYSERADAEIEYDRNRREHYSNMGKASAEQRSSKGSTKGERRLNVGSTQVEHPNLNLYPNPNNITNTDSYLDGHTNLEHGENDDPCTDSHDDSPEVDTKTAAYNGVKAHDVALEWQKRFAGIDGLSATGKITVQKETAIGTILQHYSVEEINQTFDKLAKSEFLLGGNPSGWKATFDWFIKLDNFDKVFSGNYDNHKGKKDKKFTPTDISGQYADFQPEVIEL